MDQAYWERARAIRETYARHELANVLGWAFDELDRSSPADLEVFVPEVCRRVGSVEPAWTVAMDALRGIPEKSLRGDLKRAFATIRAMAHDVATGENTAMLPVTVQLYIPDVSGDRDGKTRWTLYGRLQDALVWVAVRLFSEVPRSLIRRCALEGCPRVYVATKNQKYCANHMAEGERLVQRRAERAFRQRSKRRKKS